MRDSAPVVKRAVSEVVPADGEAPVVMDRKVAESTLEEGLEQLTQKRYTTRQTGLKNITAAMRAVYMADDVASRYRPSRLQCWCRWLFTLRACVRACVCVLHGGAARQVCWTKC